MGIDEVVWNMVNAHLSSPQVNAQSLNDVGLMFDWKKHHLVRASHKAIKQAKWPKALYS